jgi:integrase
LLSDDPIAGKMIAQPMGHADIDTTMNVYTQVLDGSLRAAVEIVGSIVTIVHKPEGTTPLTH